MNETQDKESTKIGRYTVSELLKAKEISLANCHRLDDIAQYVSRWRLYYNKGALKFAKFYVKQQIEFCAEHEYQLFEELKSSIDQNDKSIVMNLLSELQVTEGRMKKSQVVMAAQAFVDSDLSIRNKDYLRASLFGACTRVLPKLEVIPSIGRYTKPLNMSFKELGALDQDYERMREVCRLYLEHVDLKRYEYVIYPLQPIIRPVKNDIFSKIRGTAKDLRKFTRVTDGKGII